MRRKEINDVHDYDSMNLLGDCSMLSVFLFVDVTRRLLIRSLVVLLRFESLVSFVARRCVREASVVVRLLGVV